MIRRFLTWLTRRACVVELDEPVIVSDGSAWLRLAPGEPPRWFAQQWQAMGY